MHAPPEAISLVQIHTAVSKLEVRVELVERKADSTDRKLDTILRWLLGLCASTLVSALLLLANIIFTIAKDGGLKGLMHP